MTDEATTTEVKVEESPETPAPVAVPSSPGPDASLKELERYRMQLEEALEELRKERHKDREEIAAMKARLDRADDWISRAESAQAERERVKADETTLVVPPAQLGQAPSHEPATEPHDERNTASHGETKRKRLGFW